MQRKEVYATTGPRMTVLVLRWLGTLFDASDAAIARMRAGRVGYAKGVSMGGDLQDARLTAAKAPRFLVAAAQGSLTAATSTASRSSRVGWTPPARHTSASTTSRGADERAAGRQREAASPSVTRSTPRKMPRGRIASARFGAHHSLDGPRLRPRTQQAFYYGAGDRDPDAALVRVRRGALRGRSALESRCRTKSAMSHPGARLHLADLVHALIWAGVDSKNAPQASLAIVLML